MPWELERTMPRYGGRSGKPEAPEVGHEGRWKGLKVFSWGPEGVQQTLEHGNIGPGDDRIESGPAVSRHETTLRCRKPCMIGLISPDPTLSGSFGVIPAVFGSWELRPSH